MTENNLPLTSFAIGGYRSFGDKVQRFGTLSRINLFIGQNNSGKSNVLRFIHDIYPQLTNGNNGVTLSSLERHLPVSANFVTGCAISLHKDDAGLAREFFNEMSSKFKPDEYRMHFLKLIHDVFLKNAELNSSGEIVWFDFSGNRELINNH